MRYLSVCSGIEAATVAWHPLGFTPMAFSEIEKFPSAVLAHHYPDVPNLGDMTRFKEWPDANVDLLVGGTPCQSFSVAGLRAGLDDPRGSLMLIYLALARKYRPRWLVWENVPGVLSSNRGRDFGTFLGGLAECGYGFAYRVLDAQYFGLAQRRKRMFVVGHLGDWRRAAAVLFERESLSGHPPPRRETGQSVTADVAPSIGASGRGFSRTGETRGQDCVIPSFIPEIVPQAMSSKWSKGSSGPAGAEVANMVAVAFNWQNGGGYGEAHDGLGVSEDHTPPHSASQVAAVAQQTHVRRLTPRECERLQGFPDDYTLIPYRGKLAADGPRYKALGNSMAVPVMRWIGQRIQMVEDV